MLYLCLRRNFRRSCSAMQWSPSCVSLRHVVLSHRVDALHVSLLLCPFPMIAFIVFFTIPILSECIWMQSLVMLSTDNLPHLLFQIQWLDETTTGISFEHQNYFSLFFVIIIVVIVEVKSPSLDIQIKDICLLPKNVRLVIQKRAVKQL
jgi:hypothetical protein